MTSLLERTTGRAFLAGASLVALASVGGAGAIVAPVLLALQWFAARHAGKGERWLWVVLAGTTAGEAGWAVTYMAVGESGPFIWLVPLSAFVATFAVFARLLRMDTGSRTANS